MQHSTISTRTRSAANLSAMASLLFACSLAICLLHLAGVSGFIRLAPLLTFNAIWIGALALIHPGEPVKTPAAAGVSLTLNHCASRA